MSPRVHGFLDFLIFAAHWEWACSAARILSTFVWNSAFGFSMNASTALPSKLFTNRPVQSGDFPSACWTVENPLSLSRARSRWTPALQCLLPQLRWFLRPQWPDGSWFLSNPVWPVQRPQTSNEPQVDTVFVTVGFKFLWSKSTSRI